MRLGRLLIPFASVAVGIASCVSPTDTQPLVPCAVIKSSEPSLNVENTSGVEPSTHPIWAARHACRGGHVRFKLGGALSHVGHLIYHVDPQWGQQRPNLPPRDPSATWTVCGCGNFWSRNSQYPGGPVQTSQSFGEGCVMISDGFGRVNGIANYPTESYAAICASLSPP